MSEREKLKLSYIELEKKQNRENAEAIKGMIWWLIKCSFKLAAIWICYLFVDALKPYIKEIIIIGVFFICVYLKTILEETNKITLTLHQIMDKIKDLSRRDQY